MPYGDVLAVNLERLVAGQKAALARTCEYRLKIDDAGGQHRACDID